MSLQLDITIDDPRWREVGFDKLAMSAANAALVGAGVDPALAEISVLACDDAKIASLNEIFRDKPSPTNVLSWPEDDLSAQAEGQRPLVPQSGPDGVISLGDIAIAFDTCQREAVEAKIPMADHVTHLMVHGVLHLLGFDHICDPDAALMEGLEIEILGTLGVSNPYTID